MRGRLGLEIDDKPILVHGILIRSIGIDPLEAWTLIAKQALEKLYPLALRRDGGQASDPGLSIAQPALGVEGGIIDSSEGVDVPSLRLRSIDVDRGQWLTQLVAPGNARRGGCLIGARSRYPPDLDSDELPVHLDGRARVIVN
jgi:hypothetical protein